MSPTSVSLGRYADMNEKEAIWFGGWEGLLEVVITAPVIYLLVVAFVRVSGKRTTGQMNNFDWIVTVAMGSIVASSIVINTVEVAEGAGAVLMLIGLQWVLTKLTQRHGIVDRAVKVTPRILIDRGVVNEEALAAERLTKDEVATALRQRGVTRLDDVMWLMLENTGRFSVIKREAAQVGMDSFMMTDEMKRAAERAASFDEEKRRELAQRVER